MADSEDLKRLASGELDLSQCDFRQANLSGMDLRGRDFSDSLFEKAICDEARFDGSDFRGSNMIFMEARNASFDGCDLTGIHFGYIDFSGASLKDVNGTGAVFQNTKLVGANIQGAALGGGRMDADTVLDGAIVDEWTDFNEMRVLRATARNPLFRNYTFEKGVLYRQVGLPASDAENARVEKKPITDRSFPRSQIIQIAESQLDHLMKNTIVTRISAQQFASQIEEALRHVPATDDNKLAEPLQTMLEFAEVLRNLAPETEPPIRSLDHDLLEARIAELEALVARLTKQISDEQKYRMAAEELSANDGFNANFQRSAGKAAGVAAVSAAGTIGIVGVSTASVYFLGVENPLVSALLSVIRRT